jgi:hypothetical protein
VQLSRHRALIAKHVYKSPVLTTIFTGAKVR